VIKGKEIEGDRGQHNPHLWPLGFTPAPIAFPEWRNNCRLSI